MAVLNGIDYLIYLAPTVPTVPTDSSDAAYDVCGELLTLGVSDAISNVETSSKTSGISSSFVGGRGATTVNCTARFDAVGDAGQDHLQTAMEASARNVWFLITTDTVGDEEWYGKALLSSQDFTLDDQAATDIAFSLQVTGAPTRGTIT